MPRLGIDAQDQRADFGVRVLDDARLVCRPEGTAEAIGELAAAVQIGMPAIMIRPSELLNDYRTEEEDWDGPTIERLSDLLIMLQLK